MRKAPARKTRPPAKKPPASQKTASKVDESFAATLRKLKEEETKAHDRYAAESDPFAKQALLGLWLKLTDQVAKLGKVSSQVDIEQGSSIPKDEADTAWSRCCGEFRSAAEALARRVATHPMMRRVDPVDLEEMINHEVDQMLAHLHGAPWLKDEEAKS